MVTLPPLRQSYQYLPGLVISRMRRYVLILSQLLSDDIRIVSSQRLGEILQETPATIRKDMSYVGRLGVRGRGYRVRELLDALERVLAEYPQPPATSDFGIHVNYHIGGLIRQLENHGEIDRGAKGLAIRSLLLLQHELLNLERFEDESLPEKVAMVEAVLRDIRRNAPKWVADRIKAIFSEQAFSASMGVVLGVALAKSIS